MSLILTGGFFLERLSAVRPHERGVHVTLHLALDDVVEVFVRGLLVGRVEFQYFCNIETNRNV